VEIYGPSPGVIGIEPSGSAFIVPEDPMPAGEFCMEAFATGSTGRNGSFPLDRFRIVDNDLALGDVAIHAAPPDAQQRAASTALERHIAINWLAGKALLHSHTDTST
jgi:hypothetical protein